MHVRFFGSAIALSMVTSSAARDEIIPRALASARPRQDVIEREVGSSKLFPAVLAGRMVTQQYVLPGEGAIFKGDVDVFRQANNRGRVHRNLRRVEHVAIVLLHPRDSLENHNDRAPFGAHVYGLVGTVQD
jgi:hypothetical protein